MLCVGIGEAALPGVDRPHAHPQQVGHGSLGQTGTLPQRQRFVGEAIFADLIVT
jgi:hypothetical protein